jgi:medium-chain acyl-[acyl-carrier-protein] hydrolase
MARDKDLWLRLSAPKPEARLRLICLPHAGGNGYIFSEWTRALGDDIEMYAVTLPGRGTRLREAPVSRMAPLTRGLCDAIEPLCDKPYALFGHSMGGLLAYASTLPQAELGLRPPEHIFVAAALPPHAERLAPPLHARADKDLLNYLSRLGGMPAEVLGDDQIISLILPVLRADLAVCETYKPASAMPLPCPLTVFAGTADALAPLEALREWRRYGGARYAFHEMDGDHFFVHAGRCQVIAQVRAALGLPFLP